MTFTETQQNSSKLQKEIVTLKQEIRSLDTEINKLENRVTEVQHQTNVNKARMKELREHRQNLLTDGQDVTAISTEIRNINDQAELFEDELVGIEKRISKLSELKAEKLNLIKTNEMALKINSLYNHFDTYNEVAEKLATIVRDIYRLVRNDRELEQLFSKHAGEMTGALESVPRLLVNTTGKTELHTFEKHFFHAGHYKRWPERFGG